MRHRLQSQAPGARASASPGHVSSARDASRSSSVGRRLSDVATTAEPSIVESSLGSAFGGCAGGADEPGDDELALARIARAMDKAAKDLTRTRNLDEWKRTTARLDAERQQVLAGDRAVAPIDPKIAAAHVRGLGAL